MNAIPVVFRMQTKHFQIGWHEMMNARLAAETWRKKETTKTRKNNNKLNSPRISLVECLLMELSVASLSLSHETGKLVSFNFLGIELIVVQNSVWVNTSTTSKNRRWNTFVSDPCTNITGGSMLASIFNRNTFIEKTWEGSAEQRWTIKYELAVARSPMKLVIPGELTPCLRPPFSHFPHVDNPGRSLHLQNSIQNSIQKLNFNVELSSSAANANCSPNKHWSWNSIDAKDKINQPIWWITVAKLPSYRIFIK